MSGTDTSACSSGSVSVSGSITGTLNLTANGISYLRITMSETPVSCVMAGWQLSGDPYFSFTATYTVTAGNASISGTGPAGGFTASQNGNTVTCLIQTPPSFNASGSHGAVGSSTIVCNGVSTSVAGYSY